MDICCKILLKLQNALRWVFWKNYLMKVTESIKMWALNCPRSPHPPLLQIVSQLAAPKPTHNVAYADLMRFCHMPTCIHSCGAPASPLDFKNSKFARKLRLRRMHLNDNINFRLGAYLLDSVCYRKQSIFFWPNEVFNPLLALSRAPLWFSAIEPHAVFLLAAPLWPHPLS